MRLRDFRPWGLSLDARQGLDDIPATEARTAVVIDRKKPYHVNQTSPFQYPCRHDPRCSARPLRARRRSPRFYRWLRHDPLDLAATVLRLRRSEGQAFGRADHLELALDPIEPTILSFSSTPLPPIPDFRIEKRALGEIAEFAFDLPGATPRVRHVLHVEAIDPSGHTVHHYSNNMLAPRGRATMRLPLALTDAAGTWRLHAADVFSGSVTTRELQVTDK
jgi:hypothetical protein